MLTPGFTPRVILVHTCVGFPPDSDYGSVLASEVFPHLLPLDVFPLPIMYLGDPLLSLYPQVAIVVYRTRFCFF